MFWKSERQKTDREKGRYANKRRKRGVNRHSEQGM